jgi:hypothetical protein
MPYLCGGKLRNQLREPYKSSQINLQHGNFLLRFLHHVFCEVNLGDALRCRPRCCFLCWSCGMVHLDVLGAKREFRVVESPVAMAGIRSRRGDENHLAANVHLAERKSSGF